MSSFACSFWYRELVICEEKGRKWKSLQLVNSTIFYEWTNHFGTRTHTWRRHLSCMRMRGSMSNQLGGRRLCISYTYFLRKDCTCRKVSEGRLLCQNCELWINICAYIIHVMKQKLYMPFACSLRTTAFANNFVLSKESSFGSSRNRNWVSGDQYSLLVAIETQYHCNRV